MLIFILLTCVGVLHCVPHRRIQGPWFSDEFERNPFFQEPRNPFRDHFQEPRHPVPDHFQEHRTHFQEHRPFITEQTGGEFQERHPFVQERTDEPGRHFQDRNPFLQERREEPERHFQDRNPFFQEPADFFHNRNPFFPRSFNPFSGMRLPLDFLTPIQDDFASNHFRLHQDMLDRHEELLKDGAPVEIEVDAEEPLAGDSTVFVRHYVIDNDHITSNVRKITQDVMSFADSLIKLFGGQDILDEIDDLRRKIFDDNDDEGPDAVEDIEKDVKVSDDDDDTDEEDDEDTDEEDIENTDEKDDDDTVDEDDDGAEVRDVVEEDKNKDEDNIPMEDPDRSSSLDSPMSLGSIIMDTYFDEPKLYEETFPDDIEIDQEKDEETKLNVEPASLGSILAAMYLGDSKELDDSSFEIADDITDDEDSLRAVESTINEPLKGVEASEDQIVKEAEDLESEVVNSHEPIVATREEIEPLDTSEEEFREIFEDIISKEDEKEYEVSGEGEEVMETKATIPVDTMNDKYVDINDDTRNDDLVEALEDLTDMQDTAEEIKIEDAVIDETKETQDTINNPVEDSLEALEDIAAQKQISDERVEFDDANGYTLKGEQVADDVKAEALVQKLTEEGKISNTSGRDDILTNQIESA